MLLSSAALLSAEGLFHLLASRSPSWLRSVRSRLLRGSSEPEIIMYASAVLKAVQCCVIAVEILRLGGVETMATRPIIITASTALILCGQCISTLVFLKLGVSGTFFGNVYGYKTRWYSDFPFNFCADPQCCGALASIVGLFAMWSHRPGWWHVPLLEGGRYLAEACLETKPPAELICELRASFASSESTVRLDGDVVFINFHGSNKSNKFVTQISGALAIINKLVSQSNPLSVVMAGDFNHALRVVDERTLVCYTKDSGEPVLSLAMGCKVLCTQAVDGAATSCKTRVMSSQVDKIGKQSRCTIDYVLVFADDSCEILGSAVYSVEGERICGASASSVSDNFDHHAVVADVSLAGGRTMSVVTINLCGESLLSGSAARNIYEFLPATVAATMSAADRGDSSLERYLQHIRSSVDTLVRENGWTSDELAREPYRSAGVFDVHPDYRSDFLGNVGALARVVDRAFPAGDPESRAHRARVEEWCACWRRLQHDPVLEPLWSAWNVALASRGYGRATQEDVIGRLVAAAAARAGGREVLLLTQETRVGALALLRLAWSRGAELSVSSLADLLAGRLYGSIMLFRPADRDIS